MSIPARLIDREEWSKFAPWFMQVAAAGPGVAPADDIVEHTNTLVPFATTTTVVDMGCGPGQITNALLQKYGAHLPAQAKVIGADNNPAMLAQYRMRRDKEIDAGHADWKRVEAILTDVHDCAAFEDNSLSHILASFVVFLVPEPAKAINAMREKLSPGGVLAFSAWASSEWQDLMYYPTKVRKDLFMPSPPAEWTQPAGVQAQLDKIGFQSIEVTQTTGYLSFTDYDEICRFILFKMPLAARVVAQMSDGEVLQTHALMVADLRDKYPALPAQMIGTATVAYCRK
ncbi:S-adenosyl-L-methionine-dependent methyltransferase [Coniella lustricola]|uniref:S-adenosyl-L-methionine-dependent methyltransferase n=1 Tax=Coniella lustricola TaxID=2025994 RepID=A0A2T3A448_9PEZI|nr:S-adenosyl-L-methionine-dependent methyltransferase [Coniella lustricola]